MRLEIGSGYHPTAGYVHLDLNPNAPDVDIVGPAFPLDLADDSVSSMRCVDVLEHLSYRSTMTALHEWARVIEPGGELYVQVPDVDVMMRWYFSDPAKLINRLPPDLPRTPLTGLAWRLLGGHNDGVCADDGDDWRWNAHYALFTCESLRDQLAEAGFKIKHMTTNIHPNILCWAART